MLITQKQVSGKVALYNEVTQNAFIFSLSHTSYGHMFHILIRLIGLIGYFQEVHTLD